MTFLPVAAALLVSATGQYVRTKTDSSQLNAPFLFWSQNTITYLQDSAGNPETTGDSEFAAVTASFATWNGASSTCGVIQLVEGPRVSNRSAVFAEPGGGQQNVILFRQTDCSTSVPSSDPCWDEGNCYNVHDCWGYRDATIALTTTTFNAQTGQVLDADIELNAANFVFTTQSNFPCPENMQSQTCIATDVQNTMTHEIGHLLGLDHAPDPSSTMHASAPIGEVQKRTLDADSVQFICDVYPTGTTYTIQKLDSSFGSAAGCSVGGSGWMPLGVLLSWAFVARSGRRRGRKATNGGADP